MDLSISLSNRSAKPMSHLLQVSASSNLELLPLLPVDKGSASATNPIAINPHNNNNNNNHHQNHNNNNNVSSSSLVLGRQIIDVNQIPTNNGYCADSNGEIGDREQRRLKESPFYYNYYGGGAARNHHLSADHTAATDQATTSPSAAAAAVWMIKRERDQTATTATSAETTTDQQQERINQLLMHEVSSRAASFDEEDAGSTRKKLRLSKDQSALLEESFKEHSTLNPKQKTALAKQLDLTPRQVEVWFQNRRARTKLKQTEADCELLKKCCETLTQENRRLQKEVQELRAMKAVQLQQQQQQNTSSISMANNNNHHHPPPSALALPFQLRHNNNTPSSSSSDRLHHSHPPPPPSSSINSSPHNPNPLCSFCSPPSSDHRHFPTAANYI